MHYVWKRNYFGKNGQWKIQNRDDVPLLVHE
jgi:hypothetical protein